MAILIAILQGELGWVQTIAFHSNLKLLTLLDGVVLVIVIVLFKSRSRSAIRDKLAKFPCLICDVKILRPYLLSALRVLG